MIDLYDMQEKWRKDPLLCTYTLFVPQGNKLYKEQEDIIEAAIYEPETYVKSYHGAGKTYTAALVTLTFLFVYITSKVVTTAPSWNQVKFLLWSEIRNIWKKSPALEICQHMGIKLAKDPGDTILPLDEDWFAVGLSPKIEKGEDASKRMTGFHHENFLAVLDEGPAISPIVWEGIQTLLTSSNSHLLAIGNPVDSSGEFYRAFQDSHNKRINLNIFNNPNFVVNGITDMSKLKALFRLSKDEQMKAYAKMRFPFPALTNPKWAVSRLRKWGERSPLFQSRVLSQFPKQATDSLISLVDLENCHNENIDPMPSKNVLACDPARFGDDNTVIYGLRHSKECLKEVYNGRDLMYTVNRIIYYWNLTRNDVKNKFHVIVVDVIGIGSGVVDRLKEHFKDIVGAPKIVGLGFNEKPSTPYEDTCEDMVTELFKRAQEMLESKEIGINDDGELFAQLSNRRYTFTSKGRMRIESKDDYKRRTGAGSPDEGDVFLLAIYGLTMAIRSRSVREGNDRTVTQPGWK